MENAMYQSSYADLELVLKDDGASVEARKLTTKIFRIIGLIFTYLLLTFMGLIMIFPFYWMLLTSVKSGVEIKQLVPTFWPTMGFRFDNYATAMAKLDFPILIRNTLIVGIISTLGTLVTTIMAAFAFARLEFRGKNFIFAALMATMMIPGEMMVISNYTSVSLMGMTNGEPVGAFTAMIIPFMVSIFYIYLLRQNFKQIPNELYLAAKVDGKTDWQFLWKVMVPLAMPTITTILILKLMGTWNAYVWPNLIATGHTELYLITNGLRESFNATENYDEYGAQMAATVIVTLPLLLVFIFARKYIMRGVSRAGIKG
ncbi:MAG: carbohydrate ABC transporter permease [Bacilli bacterium]|nr:carbohydrate ABC transporter permease [Bacilli bacterium]